jgi:hypothetical protein
MVAAGQRAAAGELRAWDRLRSVLEQVCRTALTWRFGELRLSTRHDWPVRTQLTGERTVNGYRYGRAVRFPLLSRFTRSGLSMTYLPGGARSLTGSDFYRA